MDDTCQGLLCAAHGWASVGLQCNERCGLAAADGRSCSPGSRLSERESRSCTSSPSRMGLLPIVPQTNAEFLQTLGKDEKRIIGEFWQLVACSSSLAWRAFVCGTVRVLVLSVVSPWLRSSVVQFGADQPAQRSSK